MYFLVELREYFKQYKEVIKKDLKSVKSEPLSKRCKTGLITLGIALVVFGAGFNRYFDYQQKEFVANSIIPKTLEYKLTIKALWENIQKDKNYQIIDNLPTRNMSSSEKDKLFPDPNELDPLIDKLKKYLKFSEDYQKIVESGEMQNTLLKIESYDHYKKAGRNSACGGGVLAFLTMVNFNSLLFRYGKRKDDGVDEEIIKTQ